MKSAAKFLLPALIFLSLGFYGHSFLTQTPLFPEKISNSDYTKLVLGTSKQMGEDQYKFHNKVVYDGQNFKPNFILIVKDSFIEITNQSKEKGMWLASDNPLLSTSRPYMESEQLQAQLHELGEYKIVNKANKDANLTVKVVTNY